ncbi:PIN domain-containing protein [Phytomonospora sp. NPDC050363]|uniref:PIN domain-containing protein n=1 Tax=Phytomonospora sp. NPDC050363 TaxID=3155642 RepID=UPI0033C2D8E8
MVIYDACALYGNSVRDLLLRIGLARLVQPKWTDTILDELDRALERRPVAQEKRQRLRERINEAVPDCLVTGYESLIEGLKLPDVDDRHVLAAAIKAGADTIVTSNLADFPASALEPWNIVAESPDEFVLNLIDLDERVIYSSIQQIADSRSRPPEAFEDVLTQLERSGLVQSCAELRLGPVSISPLF